MKIKKVNKILASIMLFLILFSIIQPVFAASGSGNGLEVNMHLE